MSPFALVVAMLVVLAALEFGYRLGRRHGVTHARLEAELDRRKRERTFAVEVVGGAADGRRLTSVGTFNSIEFPVQVPYELGRGYSPFTFDVARYELDHAVYKPAKA